MDKIGRSALLLAVVVCSSQAFGQQNGSFPVRVTNIGGSHQTPGTVDSTKVPTTITFANGLVVQSVPAKKEAEKGQIVVKFPSGAVLPPFKNTELSVDGDGITLRTYEIAPATNQEGQIEALSLSQRINFDGTQTLEDDYYHRTRILISAAGVLSAQHVSNPESQCGRRDCWSDISLAELNDGRYAVLGKFVKPILFWRWLTDANPSPDATSTDRQNTVSYSKDLNEGANVQSAQIQKNLKNIATALQQPQ